MEIFKELENVRTVHTRIAGAIHRTPVLTSRTLNHDSGLELFFKCENFQKTGSFKIRGASNLILSLTDDEAKRGVATHSSGNHGAAIACAAAIRSVPAHIIMPSNSPLTKQATVKRYGGLLTLCEPTYAARQAACARIMEETGAQLAHSANDPRVITGQATVAVELAAQVPDLDLIIGPVGGGGLASGLVVAKHTLKLRPDIIAVEPEQANDTYLSLKDGKLHAPHPNTIADGLRVGLAERPFNILHATNTEVVTVSEHAIAQAMKRLWEVLKIVVEPSGATPFAAILEGKLPAHYRRIGIVVSGGNLDLTKIPWIDHPELLAPLKPAATA